MKHLFPILLLLLLGCEQQAPPRNPRGGVKPNLPREVGDGVFEPGQPAFSRLKLPQDPQAVADTSRNFYFVIDGSGSMNERISQTDRSNLRFHNRIEGAKYAVREFMNSVPADANIGLFVFDNRGFREVITLGKENRGEFLRAVDAIVPGNGTPLGEAIEGASDSLFRQRAKQLDYGEYRLIVVTDGEANGKVSISDAAAYAEERGVPLYTIGLCMKQDHDLRRFSVSYKAADSAEDLKSGLEAAIGESEVFDPSSFEPDKGSNE